jgi:hypothetical protein
MATAAGVAGGALLFQGIENLMGHGGGFGGGNQPTEVVNNYYTDGSTNPSQDDGYNVADNDTSDFDGGDDGGGFGGDV